MPKPLLQSIVILGVLMAAYAFTSRPAPVPAGWGDDFPAALETAGYGDKLVVIDFYMQRCGPCEDMDRNVLPHKEVVAALKGFVPVRVDALANAQLSNRYLVSGTPTYVVTDADGRMVDSISGFHTVDEFNAFLTYARKRADAGEYFTMGATAPGAP